MRSSSWLGKPVTEVQAEVWKLRFDPKLLLTITEIAMVTGHKAAGNILLDALRKLQARGPDLPPNSEEFELIGLAECVTGAEKLERAYEIRKEQVRRCIQALKHRLFHSS